MQFKKLLPDFALTFVVVLVVGVVVTFLFNLIAHGAGVVDLETAFRLAIILGIALPLIRRQEKKGN